MLLLNALCMGMKINFLFDWFSSSLLLLAFLSAIPVLFMPQFSSLFYGLFVPWSVFLLLREWLVVFAFQFALFVIFFGWLSFCWNRMRSGLFSWLSLRFMRCLVLYPCYRSLRLSHLSSKTTLLYTTRVLYCLQFSCTHTLEPCLRV